MKNWKKVMAGLCAAAMVGSMAMPVMAEEEEVTEEAGDEEILALDYTMIDESIFEGTWITCFDVFDIYLPSDWDVLVNVGADEEPEDNIYFQAASEDQTRSVAITYTQGEEGMTLEDMEAALTENGFSDFAYMNINDIATLAYEAPVDGGISTGGIIALDDVGGVYNVTLGAPEDDEEFQSYVNNIICSFSNTGTEKVEDIE